ncbi:uncharacterized protein LOC111082313 [Drosophila obscura]|uniref:uncharacterized protein LOC111082313 n=1 Tax=Drosophila obscura TaxID=7282 RepID=UPI001BB25BB6|nr:uncharacterized protein LOC111082313 [Drosophila obscura]
MAGNKTMDCCTLSLDEIIERRQLRPAHGGRPNDKKFNPNGNNKIRKLVNKPAFKAGTGMVGGLPSDQPASRTYDARNKIIQKTRAKITDARDVLNQNMRESGIDARQLLMERKKQIRPVPVEYAAEDPQGAIVSQGLARLMMDRKKFPPKDHRVPMPVKYVPEDRRSRGGAQEHIGQFGQRMVTMSNRPVGNIHQMCDYYNQKGNSASASAAGPFNSRLNPSAKPFAPRGYVDHDNMQHLEDEEVHHTAVHLGSNSNVQPSRYSYANFHVNRDEDVEMTTAPMQNNIASDPFSIYETARNRIERPMLPAPHGPHVVRTDGGEQLFDRCRRQLAATSNLSDSLRARLFGGEPDRRVSHGIYANENKGQANSSNASPSMVLSMSARRSPPLGMANNKKGYRLLVSNLHSNVTTSDIRELFNDIGPMYDAHVVRPGTAEVIFKSLEHAEIAVDSYHHREFDGQPMHCVLINPHSSNRSAHSASSRTVTTNSSGVEVDIDALHSVLFRDR